MMQSSELTQKIEKDLKVNSSNEKENDKNETDSFKTDSGSVPSINDDEDKYQKKETDEMSKYMKIVHDKERKLSSKLSNIGDLLSSLK